MLCSGIHDMSIFSFFSSRDSGALLLLLLLLDFSSLGAERDFEGF